MDRDVWVRTVAAIDKAVRAEPRLGRRPPVYSDGLVARMYFWAVGHDRPQSWAADRAHYGGAFRPRDLPGVSQFNRRVAEDRMPRVLRRVNDDLARHGRPSDTYTLDGKALPVGPVSKDREGFASRRDAARGKVSGGWAKASG